MKIQHLLVSSFIALSATAFAEPPKDEQAATAEQKSENIEIAVEKIERADKKVKAPQDTDLDGDGYGDVAAKAHADSDYPKGKAEAAGDPIPGIDITVSQSPPGEKASATGVDNATAGQAQAAENQKAVKLRAKARKHRKCTTSEDCDDN